MRVAKCKDCGAAFPASDRGMLPERCPHCTHIYRRRWLKGYARTKKKRDRIEMGDDGRNRRKSGAEVITGTRKCRRCGSNIAGPNWFFCGPCHSVLSSGPSDEVEHTMRPTHGSPSAILG